jgi:hypothetical protein
MKQFSQSESHFSQAEHQYPNVTGGFLAGVVHRRQGKPILTLRHQGVDGRILSEDRLAAKQNSVQSSGSCRAN